MYSKKSVPREMYLQDGRARQYDISREGRRRGKAVSLKHVAELRRLNPDVID